MPPSDATPAADPTVSDDGGCRSFADLDVQALPPLPDSPYTKTFDAVWTTVLTKHYDPTINCVDWLGAREEYGPKVATAADSATAYALMTEMLDLLQQSHLALMPPNVAAAGEPQFRTEMGPATVPITTRWIEDALTVIDPKVGGHASGLPAGAAVLTIDDAEVSALVESVSARFEGVERAFHVRHAATALLTCPVGGKKTIRYQALDAPKPKTKKVKCVDLQLERTTLGNLRNIPIEIEHRVLDGTKIGYLRFNIWMMALVPKIEAAMAELRSAGIEALVLDLRGNPGGVGMMTLPVGRTFMTEEVSLGVMRLRDGEQVFNITNVDPKAFAGPIAMLIDEGSASTSEIFGQGLQDVGRVQVFGGGASLGAALPSLIETLEGGGLLQYVVADYKSPKNIAVEGRGVVPDTIVPETRADFAAGRDPVLQAAVSALSGGS